MDPDVAIAELLLDFKEGAPHVEHFFILNLKVIFGNSMRARNEPGRKSTDERGNMLKTNKEGMGFWKVGEVNKISETIKSTVSYFVKKKNNNNNNPTLWMYNQRDWYWQTGHLEGLTAWNHYGAAWLNQPQKHLLLPTNKPTVTVIPPIVFH